MLTNGNKKKCGFEDEIVSYLYDETGAVGRRNFESHLMDCSACTDEFAAVSNARFAVFEWQKEEFAQLATPRIVIPYEPRADLATAVEPVGFLAGLRGLFDFPRLPMGLAAAALVIGLGIGLVIVTTSGDEQMASNSHLIIPDAPSAVSDRPVQASVPTVNSGDPNEIAANPVSNEPVNRKIRPVKVAENRRSNPGRQIGAVSRQPAIKASNLSLNKTQKAPVLSSYDDSDDKSLRLTDLFNDGGGTE